MSNTFEEKFVEGPGFDRIQDSKLRTQLIDIGITSGPSIAVTMLQDIVGVTEDGHLGLETLQALNKMHADDANNCLVAKRVRMIGRIVQKNPSQLKFLVEWLDRATEFLA